MNTIPDNLTKDRSVGGGKGRSVQTIDMPRREKRAGGMETPRNLRTGEPPFPD